MVVVAALAVVVGVHVSDLVGASTDVAVGFMVVVAALVDVSLAVVVGVHVSDLVGASTDVAAGFIIVVVVTYCSWCYILTSEFMLLVSWSLLLLPL